MIGSYHDLILLLFYRLIILIAQSNPYPAMTKYLFLPVVLFCLFLTKASAQDTLSVSSTQIAQALLSKIDHEVSLSEQQKAAVYELLLGRVERLIQATGQKGTDAYGKSLRKANEETLVEMRKILTKEQYVQYISLREETEKQKAKYGKARERTTQQDALLDF